MTEVDLLPEVEAESLVNAARYDVDPFRHWGIEIHLKKHGTKNTWPAKDSFGDMLRVYHATGARTAERSRAGAA